ncbi:hypothetical protein CHELA40_11117 [Chelatococcus asaccharovorans]|nr:hypothetical protein CHELA40_11117 [Chelatococcus asaccharovorans]CAH1685389.1 hypothetical protein CHELA17_64482 [Chelatococcus asaccharovorans]
MGGNGPGNPAQGKARASRYPAPHEHWLQGTRGGGSPICGRITAQSGLDLFPGVNSYVY